jgi:hypothetical protein
MSSAPDALKDENCEQPVSASWRPVLREIVRAFVRGDYQLTAPIADVAPVHVDTAEHIRAYIADYGATLVELQDETWESSCAQWMGDGWDVLVDLWTKEEGRSDLVLHLKVVESGDGVHFTVHLVYVP